MREIVAARYFGTTRRRVGVHARLPGPEPAPRAVRRRGAAARPSCPVFTELLEQKKRKEAFQLAGALFGLILAVLGAITVLFILVAPRDHAAVHRRRVHAELDDADRRADARAVPDRRAARAQRPRRRDPQRLRPLHDPGDRAAGLERRDHRGAGRAHAAVRGRRTRSTPTRSASCAGTVVQLAMACRCCGASASSCSICFDWRDPRIRQVLLLMLPVTIGLGLINFNLLINSILGSLRLRRGAGGDRRRVPHLHAARRGCSASRSRPCCSRRSAASPPAATSTACARASGNGMRQIALLLIPAAARPRCSPSRSRGSSTSAASSAPGRPTTWPRRCSGSRFSLPFAGVNLLLTRTFFSLQRPWIPTALAGVTLRRQRRRVGSRSTSRSGSRGVVIGTAVGERRDDASARRTTCGASCTASRSRRTLRGVGADAGRRGAARRRRLRRPGTALDEALGALAARADRLASASRSRSASRRLRRRGARAAHPRGAPDRRARPAAGCGATAS